MTVRNVYILRFPEMELLGRLQHVIHNNRESQGTTWVDGAGRSGQLWFRPAGAPEERDGAHQGFRAGGTLTRLHHSRWTRRLSTEPDTHSSATWAERRDSGSERCEGLACSRELWTQRSARTW